MSIQSKHVSVNLAAFNSAKFLGGLAGLSNTATVVLFRTLVMNERIAPRTDVGRELISHGFANSFGQLQAWVANHMAEAIEVLLHNAGADLVPQDRPTSITELGHRLVKGKSKTSQKVRAAEAIMRHTAFTIDRHVVTVAAQRHYALSREDALVLATVMSELLADTFYFPVSYDYRGRMYYRGGILTPQGSDLCKGLLRFADEQPIGKHGRFAIVQALADAAGFKGTKREAMAWARDMDPLELLNLVNGSEGFQAAGLAAELARLNDWVAAGKEEAAFESGVICHMDATCSGLQIAAAITGHRQTAESTNCTARAESDGKADVYGDVAEDIASRPVPLAEWCQRFGRKVTKKAVMTLGYGAGRVTLMKSVTAALAEEGIEWEWDEESEQAFFAALDAKCSATTALKDVLQAFAVECGGTFEWTTHDGFHAVHDKQAGEEVRLGAFKMEFDKVWDEDLNALAVAPNVVHSIDAAQMREAVRMLNRPVACIHDSLGVRPGDYVAAARAVRLAFVQCDARQTVRAMLDQRSMLLPILGDYDPAECLDSSYFWC